MSHVVALNEMYSNFPSLALFFFATCMHSQLNFAAFLCLLSILKKKKRKIIIRKHSQTMGWKRNKAVAPKVSIHLLPKQCVFIQNRLCRRFWPSQLFNVQIISFHSLHRSVLCNRKKFVVVVREHKKISILRRVNKILNNFLRLPPS